MSTEEKTQISSQLKASKAAVKGHLTRSFNFAKTAADADEFLVRARYSSFVPLLAKFNELQLEVESISGQCQDEERDAFEITYFETEALFRRAMSSFEQANASLGNNVTPTMAETGRVANAVANIKLPQMALPKFDGNLVEWVPFFNVFDSMIHKSQQLDDVQKFWYLKAALTGDALSIVSSLEINAINYKTAIRLLKDRFDNNEAIVQAHLRAMFDIPQIKNENYKSLRKLNDTVYKHVTALKALDEPVEEWDSILVYLVCSKLDNRTRREYEMQEAGEDKPTYESLRNFISSVCTSLEAIGGTNSDKKITDRPKGLSVTLNDCPLCRGAHSAARCPRFLELDAFGRYELSRKSGICINCLKPGHRAKQCYSKGCQKCGLKHNSLLHYEKKKDEKAEEKIASTPDDSKDVSLQSSNSKPLQVLLSTVLINVANRRGGFTLCRAVVDSGSQTCFVTEPCLKKLGLPTVMTGSKIEGIGGIERSVNERVTLNLRSLKEAFSLTIIASVLPVITSSLPQVKVDESYRMLFSHLELADPRFHEPQDIDILLSNDVFMTILKSGIYTNEEVNLKAVNTRFGWLIGGSVGQMVSSNAYMLRSLLEIESDQNLSITKMWAFEDFDQVFENRDEVQCENHFVDTVERKDDGRFSVQLPFIRTNYSFKRSREFALKQYLALEKRLERSNMRSVYGREMEDQIKLGIISELPVADDDDHSYYLPHHAVVRNTAETTKIRIVFDGTSTYDNETSLNSVLHTGKKLHNDLQVMLLRFRKPAIAFVADIEKMFSQIEVQQSHRKYQRFLWRKSKNLPIGVYEVNRVVFGLTSSPFLANRCIKQLSVENENRCNLSSKIINSDMYVDDLVTGVDSLSEAKLRVKEIVEILKQGCFKLRKWKSNSEELMRFIREHIESTDETCPNGEAFRVMGITWDPVKDSLSLNCCQQSQKVLTKRNLLSQLASIYDPFGWISPVLVTGKIIMQRCWMEKLPWDGEIDSSERLKWFQVLSELPMLSSIEVHRRIRQRKGSILRGYSDASAKAYGACVYIVDEEGAHLLMAKSRIAPIKPVSIARMELCAAVLLTKLTDYVIQAGYLDKENCELYTDSQIVIAWLLKPAKTWNVFVANRVALVHERFPNKKWRYIGTKFNPADLISRGCTPKQLISSSLWWNGPLIPNDDIPESVDDFHTDIEIRNEPKVLLSSVQKDRIWLLYSDWRKMLRVSSYVLRFIDRLKGVNTEERQGLLTATEVQETLLKLIGVVQADAFPMLINDLMNGKCQGSDNLFSLNPFIDKRGILRVGGRLTQTDFPYETRHPIILPKGGHFVELLVKNQHLKNHHLGVTGLSAVIRTKFWILNMKTVVKRVLRQCLICFKFRPLRVNQLMGSLPTDRTETVRPFFKVGVDYCGPFFVRPTRGRGKVTVKSYVCLFVCFSVKAVHLEAVFDLSSEAFLLAFQRFCARRGRPSHVFSDNGTNFVGANNVLHSLYELINSSDFRKKLSNHNSEAGITWNFIPANSPHFGGLWESGVKSAKGCLLKSMGNARLTFEEFSTLLHEVEATLNSRPLGTKPGVDQDQEILTPGHFLVGRNLKTLATERFVEFQGSMSKRFEYIQKTIQTFWDRFRTEYLLTLQKRNRKGSPVTVRVGDLGLIEKTGLSSQRWPLGRVEKTFPGRDGLVRVVEVRIGDKLYRRAVNKFYKLPDFR